MKLAFRLILVVGVALGAVCVEAADQPNVIVVMTDDQGWPEIGAHGNPVLPTPHLDKLHSESIRLTDYHASPMCTPTRGSLMTGLDPARHGAINVSAGRTLLRAELPTMASIFKSSGYATGMFGKWHLGDNYPYRPSDRGFDETLWFPSSHVNSVPDVWNNDYFNDTFMHNGEKKEYEGYCTDVYFNEAMAWMKGRAAAGEPFFTYLPTNAPHWPFWAPEEDAKLMEQLVVGGLGKLKKLSAATRENLPLYLAMIRNIDTNMGKLERFLVDNGLRDNTIVVFATDNGSTFGESYFPAGMRGKKTQLWEGGHRVPCFFRWPGGGIGGKAGGGRDFSGLTQTQDVLPTLIELCNLQGATNVKFDGMSLAQLFWTGANTAPADRMLVVNYSRMPHGFDYPSPDSPSIMRREMAAVMFGRWRLLEDRQLYNLDSDPLQATNLIASHPGMAQLMSKHLDGWWDDVKDIANEAQRVVIGHAAENPMMLTACEWLDVFVDQQGQIRKGVRKNGYWELEVAEAGTYELELRRWPREADTALAAGLPAIELTAGSQIEGKALPIASGRIYIDGRRMSKPAKAGDKAVTFTVNLQAGPARLHTWFDDATGESICGAYYVYVNKQ